MGVVIHLEGIDELTRAEQRRIGRFLQQENDTGIGFDNLIAGVVLDSCTHSEWSPGDNCPDCESKPLEWTVSSPPSTSKLIAARCSNCEMWLKRTPIYDIAADEGYVSRE